MGLGKDLALSLVGLVSWLLFSIGILVQLFVNVYVGAAITAFAVLLSLVQAGIRIQLLRAEGTLESAKRNAPKALLRNLLGVIAVAVFLVVYIGVSDVDRLFVLLLINNAAYILMSLLPTLLIMTFPEK